MLGGTWSRLEEEHSLTPLNTLSSRTLPPVAKCTPYPQRAFQYSFKFSRGSQGCQSVFITNRDPGRNLDAAFPWSSIVDPGPGAFWPGIRIQDGIKFRSGIWDEHPRSYFWELTNSFLGKKYLNSWMQIWIRYEKNGSMILGQGKISRTSKHCHEILIPYLDPWSVSVYWGSQCNIFHLCSWTFNRTVIVSVLLTKDQKKF